MLSRSSASASALCGLEMLTSGSMIGTRPAARILIPYSNCWSTMAAMPASFASLITERILVPKIPKLVRLGELVIERVDRLHQLHVILLGGQAEVHLEERDDVLRSPQVLGRGHALDGPLHRLQEQDRGDYPRAVERRVA